MDLKLYGLIQKSKKFKNDNYKIVSKLNVHVFKYY